MQLYRRIELPSKEPVNFVGTNVFQWGISSKPTDAFVEIEREKLAEALGNILGELLDCGDCEFGEKCPVINRKEWMWNECALVEKYIDNVVTKLLSKED